MTQQRLSLSSTDWFETLAKAERSHANRYQKALDALAPTATRSLPSWASASTRPRPSRPGKAK